MSVEAGRLHARAFRVAVFWTLGLLFLGSVVHATGSSLACPDWPTCYGTMVPEMSGGIFWEHLHRLVAGGLLLLWGLGTWLAYKEVGRERPGVFRAAIAGVVLLLVQSAFGGLTVIFKLPDLVSTTHLALAFSFLALTTALAAVTHREPGAETFHPSLRRWGVATASLVFAQSVLGALVRHTEAGMACPDVPLCLGRVVPPLVNLQITAHFFHRVLALAAALVVCLFAWRVHRASTSRRLRIWAWIAVSLVFVQVGLGVASVLTVLGVVPVSTHTLVAASLLATLVHMSVVAEPSRISAPPPIPVPAA